MLTLLHSDGRSWPVSDAFAELAGLPDPVLRELLNLARAQAALVAVRPDEIAHAFPCRHRREAEQRGEVVPDCRWNKDSAGGFACGQCGTWAKPDSERARIIGLAGAPAGLVHVSELRVGDVFRFEGELDSARVTAIHGPDELGGYNVRCAGRIIHCVDDRETGERVMVEIISGGLAVVS